jgi:N-methylhydantoinase B
LIRTDGTQEVLHSKLDHVKVAPGDLLLSDTWGGGGCGDPLEREIDKVMFDVDAGLVTVEGARRYGVVIGADGRADRAASAALRATIAKERGPVKLFDRGFESITELKERCFAETGLAPPEQPRFRKLSAHAGGRAG